YQRKEGLYNFSLTLDSSRNSPALVMEAIQHQLQTILGYEATVEKRPMPVWKLIARPSAFTRIKTAGDKPYFSDGTGSGGAAGFTMRNQSPTFLFMLIARYLDDHKVPFIDASGLKENIDITLDCDMTNKDDVRRSLRQYGLDIVPGRKEMFVVIVRPAKHLP
ncbi:MAG: hypothetical protein C0490_28360, partial [Marivirga sp.]|nr:hypothetical protein [Marivirga sp.]